MRVVLGFARSTWNRRIIPQHRLRKYETARTGYSVKFQVVSLRGNGVRGRSLTYELVLCSVSMLVRGCWRVECAKIWRGGHIRF